MNRRQKKWLFAIQITVSVGMLSWLFFSIVRNDDLGELVSGFTTTSPFWIVFALFFTLVSFFLATYRWQKISATLGVERPFKTMFSHFMSGQFVSNFLPSTIGGDVLRVTRLSMETGKPQNSFASVIIDRFCGWPVLAAISLMGFALSPSLYSNGKGAEGLTAVLIVGGVLVAFILLSIVATLDITSRKLKRAEGVWRYISAINIGLVALRKNILHGLEVVVITFGMQFAMILAAVGAVEALDIQEIGFYALMAWIPLVLIVQVIPISVGGFGVREIALTIAFTTLGVPDGKAVQLGLLLALLNIGVSLIGAPTLALGGIKRVQNLSATEKV